jgi:hypothetical protein
MRQKINIYMAIACVVSLEIALCPPPSSAASDLKHAKAALLAAYATAPQGYPAVRPGSPQAEKEYARPDTAAPFRWHFYNDEAIQRFEDAKMDIIADIYNPLEGAGAGANGQVEWVTEHVTCSQKAMKVTFTNGAVNRSIGIGFVPVAAEWFGGRQPQTWYTPNYRWFKVDVFNAGQEDLHIRVGPTAVPMILHPGSNVLAVKNADLAGYADLPDIGGPLVSAQCSPTVGDLKIRILETNAEATLYLDNARMEQEIPAMIRKQGWLFHFYGPGSDEGGDSKLAWPGFTQVWPRAQYSPEKKFGLVTTNRWSYPSGWSNRARDNSLVCGGAELYAPFRVDLPNGRYLVQILPGRVQFFHIHDGRNETRAVLNGVTNVLYKGWKPDDVRQNALAGQLWDYRPGACVWEGLVRPAYFGPAAPIEVEVTDGSLVLQPPCGLHALLIFPASEKEEGLREIGRLNYLLAESWDCSHGWIKGSAAAALAYPGAHDEALRPESIPERIEKLNLTPKDYERGFVPFCRGLTEHVFHDSIPTPEEMQFKELRTIATPSQTVCVTLGLLPLKEVKGLKIAVTDLKGKEGAIAASNVDARVSRTHQHTMGYGHHNHAYNQMEYYLIRRESLDLYPAAAKRVYLDIRVDPDLKPGIYEGRVELTASAGQPLAAVPLRVEVLPFALETPPVVFGGIPLAFQGGVWDGGLKLAAQYGINNAYTVAQVRSNGVVAFWPGPHAEAGAEWSGPRTEKWSLAAMERLLNNQTDFWIVDVVKVPKEHLARFTWGFWLWRSGASGRFSSLGRGALLDTGSSFNSGWPYYALLSTAADNVYAAFLPDLTDPKPNNSWNPCRDIVLIREGISDYRFLHTLDQRIKRAEEKGLKDKALAAAAAFREELRNDISPDLDKYYRRRAGSYAENWYVKPEVDWTSVKMDAKRRQLAEHIVALDQALEKK